MVQSILEKLPDVKVCSDPYPHLVIQDCLELHYYEALAKAFPPLEFIAADEKPAQNTVYLRSSDRVLGRPEIPGIWQDFFEYHTSRRIFEDFVAGWSEVIYRTHPKIEQILGKPLSDADVGVRVPGKRKSEENASHDLVLDCLFGMNSPVEELSVSRGPHVDSPAKLFSALLYFRDPEDESRGGEYTTFKPRGRAIPRNMYKAIPEDRVEEVGSVPYRANTLVIWLNSAHSIHAVSPRTLTSLPRRYIAITAESYARRVQDPFFAHHTPWNTPLHRLRTALRP